MTGSHPAGTDHPTGPHPGDFPDVPGGSGRRARGSRDAASERLTAIFPASQDDGAEERPARRTRDPQARRDALAEAVIEVIAENGIGRTTHRAVAAAAGLPLGATTYYFPTLDALIAAGLQRATEAQEADLRRWADRVRSAPELAPALVALASDYLSDRRRARIEYELCVAAVRDEALRPLAATWQDGFHDLLSDRVGSTAARNISALLDGAMLQVLVTGTELDTAALTDAINRLAVP